MLLLYLSLIENEDDKVKIAKIYENYLDWMLKMAFHYLKNESDAEDAVNNVFLSIISGSCSIPLDDENKTKSYLFICIRNSALHLKGKNERNKSINLDKLYSLSSTFDIENQIIKKDSFESLQQFVNSLPPIYKDVLALYICFGENAKGIAKRLRIPLKTAETRLNRGKNILKERFGNIEI